MKFKAVQVSPSSSHNQFLNMTFNRKFLSRAVQALTPCMVVSSLFVAVPAFAGVAPAHSLTQTAVQPISSNVEPHEPALIADLFVKNSALSQEIVNILLSICYFGLPVGLALAIWSHDKRTRDRLAELKRQIDLLERIWHRNLQA